jgi:hypothetical protein
VRTRVRVWLGVGTVLFGSACGGALPAHAPAPEWLARVPDEQVVQLERQLRGFDVAMMETGYRYGELYFAGQEGNWEAAAYHAAKIRLAIENGLERRPKRTASARPFLEGPLASIAQAAAARDPEAFATRFEELTGACNACHAREGVPFFEVQPPRAPRAPIHRTAGPSPDGAERR